MTLSPDYPLWKLLPVSTVLMCVLLSMLPLGLSSTVLAPPSFGLVAVFYWACRRPELLPPVVVFLLGVLQDFLWGGPTGLWPFAYLLAYGLTASQRFVLTGQGYTVLWFGFSIVAGCVSVAVWLLASVYYWKLLPVMPMVVQTVLTIAVFPIIERLLPKSLDTTDIIREGAGF